MRCVGRVDDIGGVDVAIEFLGDALEQPLGAGALDLHGDAGIGRLKRLAELFADRRSIDEYRITLASFFAASISCGVIETGRGRFGAHRRRKYGAKRTVVAPLRMSRLEVFAFSSRPRFVSCYRLSARQRSGGKVSQTSLPLATAVSVGVVTRKAVPSAVSTM